MGGSQEEKRALHAAGEHTKWSFSDVWHSHQSVLICLYLVSLPQYLKELPLDPSLASTHLSRLSTFYSKHYGILVNATSKSQLGQQPSIPSQVAIQHKLEAQQTLQHPCGDESSQSPEPQEGNASLFGDSSLAKPVDFAEAEPSSRASLDPDADPDVPDGVQEGGAMQQTNDGAESSASPCDEQPFDDRCLPSVATREAVPISGKSAVVWEVAPCPAAVGLDVHLPSRNSMPSSAVDCEDDPPHGSNVSPHSDSTGIAPEPSAGRHSSEFPAEEPP